MFIDDPVKKAKYESDFAEGKVPAWNPNDETAATAYVEYFNTLIGAEAFKLIKTTKFSFEFKDPNNNL